MPCARATDAAARTVEAPRRLLLVLALAAGCVAPQEPTPGTSYELRRVLAVHGRQGVAVDQEHIYVSGSAALYKYDRDGALLLANTEPFAGYAVAANHIGDIDVCEAELYVSAEFFADGVGRDIQIAVHDAETLELIRTFPFDPSSGQTEVSGICVDPQRRSVWMCSWVGGESGLHLYEYDLETGTYLRKVRLDPPPRWQQGVCAHEGVLYLTADDGDADLGEWDHVYAVDVTDAETAPVRLWRTFDDVRRAGEIEGLDFDPVTGELLVHFNRGKRIVRGMPTGLYPGYEEELHEVHVYGRRDP